MTPDRRTRRGHQSSLAAPPTAALALGARERELARAVSCSTSTLAVRAKTSTVATGRRPSKWHPAPPCRIRSAIVAPFRLKRDELEHGLPWRLMQNGPVTLYWRRVYFEQDIGALRERGYVVPSFDCRE